VEKIAKGDYVYSYFIAESDTRFAAWIIRRGDEIFVQSLMCGQWFADHFPANPQAVFGAISAFKLLSFREIPIYGVFDKSKVRPLIDKIASFEAEQKKPREAA